MLSAEEAMGPCSAGRDCNLGARTALRMLSSGHQPLGASGRAPAPLLLKTCPALCHAGVWTFYGRKKERERERGERERGNRKIMVKNKEIKESI